MWESIGYDFLDTSLLSSMELEWYHELGSAGYAPESILVRIGLMRSIGHLGSCLDFSDRTTWRCTIEQTSYHYSFSHHKGWYAWMLSDTPCGIDITKGEVRDTSLLQIHTPSEYLLLGGDTWENFTLLWSAKESYIKKYRLSLDDMRGIILLSVTDSALLLSSPSGRASIAYRYVGDFILTFTICDTEPSLPSRAL